MSSAVALTCLRPFAPPPGAGRSCRACGARPARALHVGRASWDLQYRSAPNRVAALGRSSFAGTTAALAAQLTATQRRREGTLANKAARAAAAPPPGEEEVLVKAAVGEPDKLGDCPFSQRVLLTLEEKGVPYTATFIDTSNKPQWFLDVNPEGKVPVLKHEGKWVPDSDVIARILEEKYPEPPLAAPQEKAAVGSDVFPAFLKFLKSKDPADGSEAGLVAELAALDKQLREPGPYVAGEKVTAPDLALLPKLYHVQTALGHYKQWAIPADLGALHKYLELMQGRESFRKTAAPTEVVVRGWASKV